MMQFKNNNTNKIVTRGKTFNRQWSYIQRVPVADQCAELQGICGIYVHEGRVK